MLRDLEPHLRVDPLARARGQRAGRAATGMNDGSVRSCLASPL